MPPIKIRQTSFHGGEVSPVLFSRTDIQSRKFAAASLRNFLPTSTGAAMNRPGFVYVADVKDQTRKPRLVSFTFSTSQSYLLEFGHLYVRIYQGGTLITEVVTPYTEADLPRLQYAQYADTLRITHSSYAPKGLKRTGVSTWTLTDITVVRTTPAPTGLAFVSAPVTTADSTHQVTPWDWVCTAVVKNASGIEEEGLPATKISSTCQLAPDRTVTVGSSAVTNAILYYWYRGRYGVYGYIGSSVLPSFIDSGSTPNYSDQPPSQRDPFASSEYPAVSTYFESREVFANQPSFPQRVQFSRTGRFADFDYSIPQKKDDAIDFTLASRMYEEVRALVPLQQLVILTANTEYVIDSGDAPVSFDNFQRIPIGYNGSSWVRPLVVGDSILYVTPSGTSVRELIFGGQNGWAGSEISLAASHLLAAAGRSIADWAFQKAPYSVAWAVRDDGSLVSVTYDPAYKVNAWAHHDSYAGDFVESVASIPEGSEDVLYAVWNRAGKRMIEKLAARLTVSTASSGTFLDCCTVTTGGPVVSGLTRLNGRQVYALRDGVVEGPFTVSGGSITLSASGTRIVVGLLYQPEIELLDLSIDPGDGQGDIGPDQKLVTHAVWEVDKTTGLYAGESFGDLIPWRAPLGWTMPAAGVAHDLFVVPIDSSWNRGGKAVLRQTQPLPISVLGVTRLLEVGGD
jgi:hypothetical protein